MNIRSMRVRLRRVAMLTVLAMAPPAGADFAEDFDGYPAGTGLPAPWTNQHRIAPSSIYAFEEGATRAEMSALDDVSFVTNPLGRSHFAQVNINDPIEAPGRALLAFATEIGEAYRVQSSTDLLSSDAWSAEPFQVYGTGESVYLVDPDANAGHKLYRVLKVPGPDPPGDGIADAYTAAVAPNYWGFHQPLHGDHGQLTDGITVNQWNTPEGPFYSLPSSMGWAGRQAVVVFDLGWIRPVSGFGFHSVLSPWGPWWPHTITVLVSDDNLAYRLAGPPVTVDPGQLSPPLTAAEVQAAIDRTPLGEPTMHWFRYQGYQTRGRYVALLMDFHPEVGVIVLDEVEIHEGVPEGLSSLPGGPVFAGSDGARSSYALYQSLQERLTRDASALRQEVGASAIDPAPRQALLDQLDAVDAQIGDLEVPPVDGFQAVLPTGDLHAGLFAVQAAWWRELDGHTGAGTPDADLLHVWQNHRWDPLPLIGVPPAETAAVAAVMGRNAYRGDVLNLSWSGTAPTTMTVQVSGLPAEAVELFHVPWVDTHAMEPVATALAPLPMNQDAFTVRVVPGLTCQIWIRFRSHGLPAHIDTGEFIVRLGPGVAAAVPVSLEVLPVLLPESLALSIGGWEYAWPGVMQVTGENLDAYVAILKQYGVNVSWLSGAMPVGTHDVDGTLIDPPPRHEVDHWLHHWPTSRWHAVTAGAVVDKPDAVVAAWAADWAGYVQQQGLPPEQVLLLLIDEPNSEAQLNEILRLGRIIKQSSGFKIFNDLHFPDPTVAPPVIGQVMAEASDVQCFNVGHYLGDPAANDAFKSTHGRPGLEWWCYTGGQADRLSDPYTAWLLRAWFCFDKELTGAHWWSFGDGNGGFSWNEYLNNGPSRSPLYLSCDAVAASKSMEAMREGAQDYEILHMLKAAHAQQAPGSLRTAMESLLTTDIPGVLGAHTIALYPWSTAKDRTEADQVRIDALRLLASAGK